jgi:hypothetical protein
MLDIKHHDAGYLSLSTGHWFLDTGYLSLDTGYWLLVYITDPVE